MDHRRLHDPGYRNRSPSRNHSWASGDQGALVCLHSLNCPRFSRSINSLAIGADGEVMVRRERDLRLLLTTIAEQANAQLVEIRHTNGGHICATLVKDGRPITLISGSSPSDYRSDLNMLALAKHQLLRTETASSSSPTQRATVIASNNSSPPPGAWRKPLRFRGSR